MSDWFQANTRRPITVSVALVLLVWTGVGAKSFFDLKRTQEIGLAQHVQVFALALSQKNRILADSMLQMAQIQLRAKSAFLCQGPVALIWAGSADHACDTKGSLTARSISAPIPGFADYALHMAFPRFELSPEQIALLLGTLALVIVTILILQRVRRKFETEIIGPLQEGLFGEMPLDISEFEELRKAHHQSKTSGAQIAAADAVINVARQVAHDIRSPLSALTMVLSTFKDLPEEKTKLIRSATSRINDIANSLLKQGSVVAPSIEHRTSVSAEKTELAMLASVIDELISEKRVEYRDRPDIEIQAILDDGYGLFSAAVPAQLARVLSNLINNSVEALNGNGKAAIQLERRGQKASIRVIDNGCGIPAALLPRLGERGVTLGKTGANSSGSGLGLWHAKQTIEELGGEVRFNSKEGVGTEVTLLMPLISPPTYFLSQMEIRPGSTIVIVDDESSVHRMWLDRFSLIPHFAATGVTLKSFSSTDRFREWAFKSMNRCDLVLVDHDFQGHGTNGFDLISDLNLEGRAILVTSRYFDDSVRLKAQDTGLQVLPKWLVPYVPIQIGEPSRPPYKLFQN